MDSFRSYYMLLCSLCAGVAGQDQLQYAGCCFWNFKSRFDLVVSIHAGILLKLAGEGLGVTFCVSDCITAGCPSLTFPLGFFSN